MIVIPAIDIRNGKCVRLFQGDYEQETVYADDPIAVARRWAELGAERLHVVDLDGALADGPRNLDLVRQIVASVRVPVQLGGGLKSAADVERALAIGVDRAILGTVALTDPSLTAELAARHGARVAVGIDARDGLVAVRGWRETSTVRAIDLGRELVDLGVGRIIYTDISRDGTLGEPNYEGLREMIERLGVPVVASGGVSALAHLRRLASLGAEATIVGRALYTGDLDLPAARAAAGEEGV